MVYPVEVVFAPKKSTIVIEVIGRSKLASSSYNVANVTSAKPRLQKELSEESQLKLNYGIIYTVLGPSVK